MQDQQAGRVDGDARVGDAFAVAAEVDQRLPERGARQSALAGQVQGALSWFVDSYARLTEWRATVERVTGFQEAVAAARAAAAEGEGVQAVAEPRPDLALQDVTLALPDGRVLLRDAAALYADFDAGADADRVDTSLRRLGVRKARRRRQRPTFGWEALTPMELSVSALAAQGFTNPEIGSRLYISRRTVETHLSHVYTKLGFTSRSQLAAEVSRRAVTDSVVSDHGPRR